MQSLSLRLITFGLRVAAATGPSSLDHALTLSLPRRFSALSFPSKGIQVPSRILMKKAHRPSGSTMASHPFTRPPTPRLRRHATRDATVPRRPCVRPGHPESSRRAMGTAESVVSVPATRSARAGTTGRNRRVVLDGKDGHRSEEAEERERWVLVWVLSVLRRVGLQDIVSFGTWNIL